MKNLLYILLLVLSVASALGQTRTYVSDPYTGYRAQTTNTTEGVALLTSPVNSYAINSLSNIAYLNYLNVMAMSNILSRATSGVGPFYVNQGSLSNLFDWVTAVGWPVETFVSQYQVYPVNAAVTNGNALCDAQQLILTSNTNKPVLLTASYILNTNVSTLLPWVKVHVFKAEPSTLTQWGGLAWSYTDYTNYLGCLAFTNVWNTTGTGAVQTISCNMPLAPTNWFVPVTRQVAYTNNADGPKDTILWGVQLGK